MREQNWTRPSRRLASAEGRFQRLSLTGIEVDRSLRARASGKFKPNVERIASTQSRRLVRRREAR